MKFRGPFGKQMRMATALTANKKNESRAQERADGLEEASRILEKWQEHTFSEVRECAELLLVSGIITDEQSKDWISGMGSRPDSQASKITLKEAALANPKVRRERDVRPVEFRRHRRELEEFIKWSGKSYLVEVKRSDILAWVEKMKTDGTSFDGRRHKLMFIRYACQMAGDYGLVDVIGTFQLDRKESGDKKAPEAYSSEELGKVLKHLQETPERARWLACVGLMAFCGLRPSEVTRLRSGDVQGDVVYVGRIKRKTAASERRLVMPATVAKWVEAIKPENPHAVLIGSGHHGRKGQEYDLRNFARYLGDRIRDSGVNWKGAKAFQKTFATLATWEWKLPGQFIDVYMARKVAMIHGTTAGHYLSRDIEKQMRPVARKIDREIGKILKC